MGLDSVGVDVDSSGAAVGGNGGGAAIGGGVGSDVGGCCGVNVGSVDGNGNGSDVDDIYIIIIKNKLNK